MSQVTQELYRAWQRANIRALNAELSANRALLRASTSLKYQWTLMRARQLRREASARLQRWVDACRV